MNLFIELGGQWTLTDADGRYRCDIVLPGDAISALHDAGLIPDPYWGRNEYDLRWISQRRWTLSRTVTLDNPDVVLVLSELDTLATVRWNGVTVLDCANAFRRYRADLTGLATKGENRVEIDFSPLTEAIDAQQAAQPFPIPYSKNCPIPNGNMIRKPACDFGWDWNIALAPFGLYGDIRLEPAAVARIDRLAIAQDHGDAAVTLRVTVHATHAEAIEAVVEFGGTRAVARIGDGRADVAITVENPDLWWPVGLGDQTLHDLTVTVGDARESRRIGLRKMELITEKDAAGLGFKFRINGHDTFARGANWIPADALAGQITVEKTRALLQSAVDANMNMIRVWGGGRYEPTWFYDLCDEMGLLVWQDFMFACNIYPSTPDFLSEVRAEVADNVARMHHHACIALWCGDNELVGALSWYDVTRGDRDRYLVNYDRLNRCIEDALRETDPGAIWWPSSPTPGPMSFGDAWHDDANGDMHFWSVWHEGRDFDHYRDVSPRFCSEFGFQSYPSLSAVRKFAGPDDMNIAAPVLESHQKNAGGNARIAETMFRYFRWPEKFDDFVYLSQVQQGLAIKTAVTHWRSLRPHCMGALIWQLNDTWPVCSWASLDHGGNWKLLHHMARHFFAPVTVSVVPLGDVLVLRGVNDTRAAVGLTVSAMAVDTSGQTRTLGQGKGHVEGTAVDLLAVPMAELAPNEMLAVVWEGSDGSKGGDVFAPRPYKAYDLLPTNLTHTAVQADGNWTLIITAGALAHYVSIESDLPGRFSNNAFHLFPGHPATITFAPDEGATNPAFVLRDLYSATTARHS